MRRGARYRELYIPGLKWRSVGRREAFNVACLLFFSQAGIPLRMPLFAQISTILNAKSESHRGRRVACVVTASSVLHLPKQAHSNISQRLVWNHVL